jgi:UDP-N-acetylmuramate dehydrogenase
MLEAHRVPLAPMTTLKLGGEAARFVELASEGDIEAVARDVDASGAPLFVLGGGSNVVVGDGGVDGLVARMAVRGVKVDREGAHVVVHVGAGEPWDDLVARAVDEGWSGLEAMSGIPGLVGATPMQNVGAYGSDVSESIARVRAYDRRARAFVDLAPEACAFAYRASLFKTTDRHVIARVSFRLRDDGGRGVAVRYAELARALAVPEGDRAPARPVRETVLLLRRAKGMVVDANDVDSTSAGSFFVNPVVDDAGLAAIEELADALGPMPRFSMPDGRWKLSAGWLIERAGFAKGYTRGPVGVSRKHALALVHRGGGTTAQLLDLARDIRDAVDGRFGVRLVPEPVLVGCAL